MNLAFANPVHRRKQRLSRPKSKHLQALPQPQNRTRPIPRRGLNPEARRHLIPLIVLRLQRHNPIRAIALQQDKAKISLNLLLRGVPVHLTDNPVVFS